MPALIIDSVSFTYLKVSVVGGYSELLFSLLFLFRLGILAGTTNFILKYSYG